MRIALVVPGLHTRGGTERCVAGLAGALRARGHDVTVFASVRDPAVLPGARCHCVPVLPRPNLARFASFLVMSALVRAWARVVGGERFDVVHSTGPDVLRPDVATFHACSAAFARRLREEPAGPDWQRLAGLRRWSNAAAYRAIAACERYVLTRGARRVIAVSETLGRELAAFHPIPPGRVAIVRNGVDPAEFGEPDALRAAARRALALEDGQPAVLFVGHNWARKGLDTLVRAMAGAGGHGPGPRPVLLVAGGTGSPAYRAAVHARLGGRVRFLGTRGDMARVYAAADVCALPTTHEPYGLPVLEAMAAGVPVVVSRAAGVAEIIRDGVDGLLLDDPRDARELAAALERVIGDPALAKSLAAHARITSAQHTWDRVAARVEAVYRELADAQR